MAERDTQTRDANAKAPLVIRNAALRWTVSRCTSRTSEDSSGSAARSLVVVAAAVLGAVAVLVVQVGRAQVDGVHHHSHHLCVDVEQKITGAAERVFTGLTGTDHEQCGISLHRKQDSIRHRKSRRSLENNVVILLPPLFKQLSHGS